MALRPPTPVFQPTTKWLFMADRLRSMLSPSIPPLIKIPFILVAMIGLQVAVTPPHPPPAKDEEAESTKLEAAIKQRSAPIVVKVISWGAALSEIAVILARSAPLLPISKHILSNLVLSDGAADHIRPSPWFFLGACLAATGGLVRYKCYKALGCMFTYEMSIRKNHVLITTGPYSIVRHPGYSGILVTMTGMVMLHGSKGSWARESGIMNSIFMRGTILLNTVVIVTITVGLLKRMSKEDKVLRDLSMKEWDEWARRVPYKLIPWIF